MRVYNQSNSINPAIFETNKTTAKSTENSTFSDYMKAMQSTVSAKGSRVDNVSAEYTLPMDTNKGNVKINLDSYFESMAPSSEPRSLLDIPLLLPTAHNVDTLAKYSEQKFKDLIQQYNIPKPPATIEFDQEGQLVLPSDYPYSAQLKQAFSENPQVERILSTTAAIASHYAGIMESQPFRDEMSTARNQADRDRIVEKYNYLFDDNRQGMQIILSFLDDGSMLIGGRSSTNENNALFKVDS